MKPKEILKSLSQQNYGDTIIWIVVFILATFSIMAVYSTGAKLSYGSRDSLGFLFSGHVMFILLSFIVIFVFQKVNYRTWGRLSTLGLIIGIIVLFATLLLGVSEGGSKRSIEIFGHKIQTIHFIEFCVVVYLSAWISRAKDKINDIKHIYLPMLFYVLFFCALIMTQKTSASLILGCTCMAMIFVSRLKSKYLFATIGIAVVLLSIGIAFLMSDAINTQAENKVFKRLTTAKVRIENFSNKDNVHKDILTTEAAIACSSILPHPGTTIHSNSVQESYSDYIFAFFVEEYGILFGALLILMYLILFYRAITIARIMPIGFGGYLATGIGFLITFQAFTHICVCLGIAPATGETLPFFSKGGVSILTTAAEIGILINISKEANRINKERHKNSKKRQLAGTDNSIVEGTNNIQHE
ncbi:MAG: FtsW/RodA/SpoVE family cell cycle protein [Bacteroidales bacterium]|nr:FtsW/RodA/SpoVE family cell cycle protein [Bacteroidales bacterium]